jgi:hypothetical protein
MNRREFIQHLALIAAGAAAMPAQLAAFERLYEINTPKVATGIIRIDDMYLFFGGEPRDAAAVIKLRGSATVLPIGLNTRATFRYVPPPDSPFLTTVDDCQWMVTGQYRDGSHCHFDLGGFLRFTDQNGRLHTIEFDGRRTHLSEYLS